MRTLFLILFVMLAGCLYSQPVQIYADASDDTNFVSLQKQLSIRPLMAFFSIAADPDQNIIIINPAQSDERQYKWSQLSPLLQTYILKKYAIRY